MTLDLDLVYREHRHVVAGYLRRLWPTASPADIEDLVQDTFLKAHRHIDSYQERGHPPTAWLCRIARNALLDHHRRAASRPRAISFEAVPVLAVTGYEDGIVRHLSSDDLTPFLAVLTPRQRDVLDARFWRGLTLIETAAALSLTVEAVKKLQHRAVAQLRRHLAANGWDEAA